MAGVVSTTGIISGIDYNQLISGLMAIERQPIQQLQQRITLATQQQTVLQELSAQLLALSTRAQSLGDADFFQSATVTSSNQNALLATVTGTPVPGTHLFTVARVAASGHIMSRGFTDADQTPVGAGTFSITAGGSRLDESTSLAVLNGYEGVSGGSIRITDRAGRTADVDLSLAATVAEVLDAINSAADIDVVASVQGDSIVITDLTGQTSSNLIVEDVAGGSAAADLGIAASVASDQIVGLDRNNLSDITPISLLNDGTGVSFKGGLTDFVITRTDAVAISVDITGDVTLGDILDTINNAPENADGLLVAQIAADGNRIELVDSSGGPGTLSVAAQNDSQAAAELGILGSAAGDTLTGDAILPGLDTVLLSTLQGGSGVAPGSILLQDRTGSQATVDLADAETLAEVIDAINASGLDLVASVKPSGTGLRITDTSDGNGDLVVQEVDSTTAADLGILTAGVASDVLDGIHLHRQFISEYTRLDTLNGGRGVDAGQFRITDSTGATATVDLSQADDVTIGDVIDEINSRPVGVTASINATGDGILLTDTAGGSGSLLVADIDSGTTAADLNIAGQADEATPTVIDGSFTYTFTIDADDTLEDVMAAINQADGAFTAAIVNDGSGVAPFRLSVMSDATGRRGELLFDSETSSLGLAVIQRGQDARLVMGAGGPNPVIIQSSDNSFADVIEGLTLDARQVSSEPGTITVAEDTDAIISSIQDFVTDFNDIQDRISDATASDPETEQAGILLGNATLLRVQQSLFSAIFDTSVSGGGFSTIMEVGFSFTEGGHLSFDEQEFRAAYEANPDGVRALFSDEDSGLGNRVHARLEFLTDQYDGLLTRATEALGDRVELFNRRVEHLELVIAAREEALRRQFTSLETTLARLQLQSRAVAGLPSFSIDAGFSALM